jgi:hypothetical protein
MDQNHVKTSPFLIRFYRIRKIINVYVRQKRSNIDVLNTYKHVYFRIIRLIKSINLNIFCHFTFINVNIIAMVV